LHEATEVIMRRVAAELGVLRGETPPEELYDPRKHKATEPKASDGNSPKASDDNGPKVSDDNGEDKESR
jgi:hypothetical protein